MNVEPTPGLLDTLISPCIARTSCWVTQRPTPKPPLGLTRGRVWKRLKICAFNRPPRAVSNGIRKEVFQNLLHGHRITLSSYSFLHAQASGAAGTLGQWDHVRRYPP